jgi:hypothetical protein
MLVPVTQRASFEHRNAITSAASSLRPSNGPRFSTPFERFEFFGPSPVVASSLRSASLSRPWLSHRLNRLGSRFRRQNNRATLVSKRHAHLVGEVFLILAGEKFFAVYKEQERGRR